MNKNMIIDKVEIKNVKSDAFLTTKDWQMTVGLFNENGETGTFVSGVLNYENMKQYQEGFLTAVDRCGWMEVLHGPKLTEVVANYSEEEIVSLSAENGNIFKDEVLAISAAENTVSQ